jgi:alkaline phosphatase
LYLDPLLQVMRDPEAHKVQMLIELKTEAAPTLGALVRLLETNYPALVRDGRIKWAITGKLPDYNLWNTFPAYIGFDGDFTISYPASALQRVALFSADLKQYTRWYGDGVIPASDRERLEQVIARTHALGKPVRFWDAPDNPNAWTQLMGLKADWINTDHIQALSAFLKK